MGGGDAAGRGGLLPVVDGERYKGGDGLRGVGRLILADGGREDGGVANADDGAAVGELGEVADAQFQRRTEIFKHDVLYLLFINSTEITYPFGSSIFRWIFCFLEL